MVVESSKDLEAVIGRENQNRHVKIRKEAEIKIKAVGENIAAKTTRLALMVVVVLSREIKSQNEIGKTLKREEKRT